MSILTGNPANRSVKRFLMLKRQHGRGREKRGLLAVHDGLERGAHGDLGLAVPDVAAQQTIHRRRRLHVALDVGDRIRLIDRQVPFERIFELTLPVGIRIERVPRHRLARGVQLEQLLGHVAHGLLDPGLRALPGGAAQFVERRLRGAAVLLNEIEPLDGDEELVFARVAKLHELLHRVADADLLQPDELSDAVVDVDDQVADLEIAQIRKKGLCNRPVAIAAPLDPGAILVEHIRLGDDLKLRAWQDGSLWTAGRP